MKHVLKTAGTFLIAIVLLCSVISLEVYATPNDDLLKAAEGGDVEAIQKALKNGADVNAKITEGNFKGATVLMLAVVTTQLDIAKLLIEYGADVNATVTEGEIKGVTVLMIAAGTGYTDMVKLLLEHGADVNAKVAEGDTALMIAAMQGHPEVVKLLLEHGADPNATNEDGKTALIYAESEKHPDVVRVLDAAGIQETINKYAGSWECTFGGNDADAAFAIQTTPDGGYIVAGGTFSKGAGGVDVWVIKLDAQGQSMWDRTFGGSGEDFATAIQVMPDGGYIVVGHTESKGVGGKDIWVLKLDAQGQLMWDRTFGGHEDDEARAMQTTSDSGYIVAGVTGSKGAGKDDVWVLKLDAQGQLLWDRTFGGNEEDWANAIQTTSDGGYIVAGSTESKGASGKDIWVLKLDAQGQLMWDRTFGDSDGENLVAAIQTTPDGGYIVASSITEDVWVLKLDTHGQLMWDRTFGGDDFDVATAIQMTPDGGYIVAGYTWSKGAGKGDVWVLKLDAQGQLMWDYTFGGRETDDPRAIQTTSDGGYIVAGYTESKGAGAEDVWVIKLSAEVDNIAKSSERTFGSSGEDFATAIQTTLDGGYIVAGVTYSEGVSWHDVWVLKLDAQGQLLWDRTFGGDGLDWATAIQTTSDGGYIVAGYTDSKGAGENDVWVLKLDAQGQLMWDRTFGGNAVDWAFAIQPTSDGGYIVAGSTKSKGAGEYDVWVLKLDTQGQLMWDRTFGGNEDDRANAIQITPDGGYIVAGSTESKGAGGKDVWVFNLDTQGELMWDRTFGGSEDDEARAIQITPDGGYIVACVTLSKGAGEFDVWVIKLDVQGQLMWDHAFGGSEDDEARAIQITPDGGYIVAGFTRSKGAGEHDVWVLKLDAQGQLMWDYAFGGSEDDEARAIQITPDSGYIVAGFTRSKGAGKGDVWVLKLDTQGELKWDHTFGGDDEDLATAIQTTPNDGYIVVGITKSKGAGEFDVWVLKLNKDGLLTKDE